MTAFHVVFDRAHNKVGFGPISTCPSQAGLITATVTTQPLTTHTLTTSSVTTQPLTTHTLTTSSVTIQPLTTHTLTTSSVTIQPLTTHTLTTSSATIQPLTTHTLTTSPSITSGRLLTTGSSVQICHFEDMFSNLNCIGLLFSYPNIPNQVYSFADFYTISFNNFTANTGDIEGSLAVQNNYNVQAGFSVGYGSPSVLTYSLVVGNNANWTSGSIYNGNIFVGESFIASADLILKRTGNCASPNCLANAFNNAQSCYIQFSSYSAGLPVNTVSTTVNSVFTITCNNFGDLQYVVQVNSTTISNTNQIQFLNCNPQNSVVINVLKANAISDVVNFNVGNWIISGFKSSSILWNFPGSGRTVNVHTSISGNMLCPESTLNQQAGTIWGKVVAGDIAFVTQINLPVCPPKYVTTNALTTKGLTTAGITSGIQQSVTTGFDLQQLNKVMNQTCLFFEKDSILNPPCNGYELTFPGDSNIYSFLNYAIISFGDFIANTGDVTGAIAIDRNFLVSNGFSVGGDAWFKNPIPPTPYTMIVGHNATWNSGSLLQNAFSSTGKMFVGSVLNAPSYLALQRTGSCPNNNINCLDSEFSNLQQCYNSLSANLALGITNVNPVLTGGTLSLTCTSSLSTRYYISLTDLILNQVTSYVLVNCNTNANYVINVLGSGDILFQGNAFPLSSNKAGNIVYNIIGSGRTIRSTNYVQGSILGPSNTLFQNSGFIVGKIIVGNISMSTQINAPTCSTSFN
jgi:choice-of-anchor A domain-containing protein